jgi:hypothetical protein
VQIGYSDEYKYSDEYSDGYSDEYRHSDEYSLSKPRTPLQAEVKPW